MKEISMFKTQAPKKISITVGISAYNEEANIVHLLESILKQKDDNFVLKEIIILSDASTDKTVEKVRSLHDSRIHCRDEKNQRGKIQRMNEIFRTSKTDLLAIFDADVVLATSSTLSELVTPFLKEHNVGLVSGNKEPLAATNFIEQSIHLALRSYRRIGQELKNGSNPHTCSGCILVLSKEFYTSLNLPKDLFVDDVYLYFACIDKGFLYRFSKTAKVFFRTSSNLKDYIAQNTRFVSSDPFVEKDFGHLLKKEYKTPSSLKYRILFQELSKMPLHALFIFCLNYYCRKKGIHKVGIKQGKWNIARSTKRALSMTLV